MKSSSSRNLASSPNNSRSRHQVHPNTRYHQTGPHEKFILLQIIQACLFTSRITFMLYDVIHAVLHKPVIYERIGWILGGNPLESENLYTAAVGLISLFLISMIIFTFIYNYLLVHENLPGIIIMTLCLGLVFLYNLFNFGFFSLVESTIVCVGSAVELVALVYLIFLIRHKKQVRYIQKYEHRFSIAAGQQPVNGTQGAGNRTLPHQKRMQATATPPAITISYTGNGKEATVDEEGEGYEGEEEAGSPGDQESADLASLSQLDLEEDGSKSDRGSSYHEGSDDGQEGEHLQHREDLEPPSRPKTSHRHHRVRAKPNLPSDESESSVSVVDPRHHPRHSKHHTHESGSHPLSKSRDHLTVPGQFANVPEEDDEEEDGEMKAEEPPEEIVVEVRPKGPKRSGHQQANGQQPNGGHSQDRHSQSRHHHSQPKLSDQSHPSNGRSRSERHHHQAERLHSSRQAPQLSAHQPAPTRSYSDQSFDQSPSAFTTNPLYQQAVEAQVYRTQAPLHQPSTSGYQSSHAKQKHQQSSSRHQQMDPYYHQMQHQAQHQHPTSSSYAYAQQSRDQLAYPGEDYHQPEERDSYRR